MWFQHINLGCSEYEVAEATVHVLIEIKMVERFDKVSPVEMSIYSEHLSKYCLANINKFLRKSTALANPITRPGKLRERGCECSWASRNGCARVRGIDSTRSIGCASNFWAATVVTVGDSGGISGKNGGIIDLARNPTLHEGDVLVSWNLDGLLARIQPSEGVVTRNYLSDIRAINVRYYRLTRQQTCEGKSEGYKWCYHLLLFRESPEQSSTRYDNAQQLQTLEYDCQNGYS